MTGTTGKGPAPGDASPDSAAGADAAEAAWHELVRASERTVRYLEDQDLSTFRRDERTYDGVVRNLQLLVQAGATLREAPDTALDDQHARMLRRFQEVVEASAERRNHDDVWAVATRDVPALLVALRDTGGGTPGEQVDPDAIGRNAEAPGQIPARGWRDVLIRVWYRLFDDYVFIVAAGVGFYGLFSVFPALATLVSAYGLLFDAADVNRQVAAVAALLPAEAAGIVREQLTRLVENPDLTLSVGAIVTFGITLWSARAGVGALMMAMNIAFREQEKRSMLVWYAWSLLLTLGAVLYGVVVIALVVALPAVLAALGFGQGDWIGLLRWPILAVTTMLALSIIYRYGPSRRRARWRWVTWGAIGATFTWLLASVLFSAYIGSFGNYNQLYGSMAAVIILMLWFYVSALVILLGAEFDAEIEHQTQVDSTVGPPRPIGRRGAFVADSVGQRY